MKTNDLIQQLLKSEKITFVDVGAMGGVKELPLLAPWITTIAFEPNPEELLKLKNESVKNAPYSSLNFQEAALGDIDGTTTLYVNKQASYSSFLKTNYESLKWHLSQVKQYQDWSDSFTEQQRIEVKTCTLDSAMKSLGVKDINYLKLDTQGSELLILKGATSLLNSESIHVIKCEVSFIPVYNDQCLFSDIDVFLRSNGFEFVDCIFYPNSLSEEAAFTVKRVYDLPRYAQVGDAIFVKRPGSENNPIDLLKTGLILAELRYFSISHLFLKQAMLNDETIASLFRYFKKPSPRDYFKSLLKLWTPPILLDRLKRLLRK